MPLSVHTAADEAPFLTRCCGHWQVATKLGGRVDYHHTVRDFDITISGTDASARDWENVPKWNDFVVTADSRFRGASRSIASASIWQ